MIRKVSNVVLVMTEIIYSSPGLQGVIAENLDPFLLLFDLAGTPPSGSKKQSEPYRKPCRAFKVGILMLKVSDVKPNQRQDRRCSNFEQLTTHSIRFVTYINIHRMFRHLDRCEVFSDHH